MFFEIILQIFQLNSMNAGMRTHARTHASKHSHECTCMHAPKEGWGWKSGNTECEENENNDGLEAAAIFDKLNKMASHSTSRQKVCLCGRRAKREISGEEKTKVNAERPDKVDFTKDCVPSGVVNDALYLSEQRRKLALDSGNNIWEMVVYLY